MSLKVAVVKSPGPRRATSFAPQGSDLLKRTTSARVSSSISTGPFSAVLGSAKKSDAASTSPPRSASTQPPITSTSAESAPPGTLGGG